MKYVLVSTNDECMEINHKVFDSYQEAYDEMESDWMDNDGNTEFGDTIESMRACICQEYVYLWKIIEVE